MRRVLSLALVVAASASATAFPYWRIEAAAGDAPRIPLCAGLTIVDAVKYKMQRQSSQPERIPVIVNGTRVDLPVIHAKGSNLGDIVEMFILDDEDNPMNLRLVLASGPGGRFNRAEGRTVKISFRCEAATTVKSAPPPSPIGQALLTSGRADVYDLYFDFNSDALREESEPTLREIADVLRRHADWKLSVEGHTD